MKLSNREFEVAKLVAQGMRTSEIASNLGIAASTVTTHLNKVMKSLGIRSRHEVRAALSIIGNDKELLALRTSIVVPGHPTESIRLFLQGHCFSSDEVEEFYRQFIEVACIATLITK